MIRTTTVAAATALALVLGVPAAFAQSSTTPLPQAQNAALNITPNASMVTMFDNAKTSLPDAISTAEGNTNGRNSNSKAFAASFVNDNGTPVYLVDTLSDHSVYQLQIDANTGKPIGQAKIIQESQLPQQERTLLATLPEAKTSLSDAVGNATGKLGGKAIDAAITEANGQIAYDVTVINNGQVEKASIDQANGKVAALPVPGEGSGSSTQK
jgi:uncharacterized membrane protein YkoI